MSIVKGYATLFEKGGLFKPEYKGTLSVHEINKIGLEFTEKVWKFKYWVTKTPIGRIPEDWEVVRLEDVTDEIYYDITAKAVENDTGLRMLRTTHINNYSVEWENCILWDNRTQE